MTLQMPAFSTGPGPCAGPRQDTHGHKAPLFLCTGPWLGTHRERFMATSRPARVTVVLKLLPAVSVPASHTHGVSTHLGQWHDLLHPRQWHSGLSGTAQKVQSTEGRPGMATAGQPLRPPGPASDGLGLVQRSREALNSATTALPGPH